MNEFVKTYYEQVDSIMVNKNKIKALKSKKELTSKGAQELKKLQDLLKLDMQDLITYEEDATLAEQFLAERESIPQRVTKQKISLNESVRTIAPPQKYKVKSVVVPEASKHVKIGYINSINSRLKHLLGEEEINEAISRITKAHGATEMKKIYNYYKQLSRGPRPERLLPQKASSSTDTPIVQSKPPKTISKQLAETQTSQTQTLVPLNAFKFIEKGEKRFLEPMTPEKAEELAIKKKTITSETILNPDRFKRKPHVWYSRAR